MQFSQHKIQQKVKLRNKRGKTKEKETKNRVTKQIQTS